VGEGGATSIDGNTSSDTAADGAASVDGGATAFVHPGALDSKEELDFVKAQIAAGKQPWAGLYAKLKSSSAAVRTPNGLVTLNSTGADANTSRDDALGAYTQALLWYYSGEEKYAKGAVAILNAWAGLKAFVGGSDQDKLQAGWIGAVFAPAAEIMRGYSGWAAADVANLQAMFKRAFYLQLNIMSKWNGNVDLTQIDAMMSIAVFNDDPAEFAAGIERWHKRVPSYFYLGPDPVPQIPGDGGNAQVFWTNPTKWVDGLTQETCRDNGHHAQFGMGSALHAAEVAWHQGVDLYTGEAARFTATLELMATQFLTGDMQGTCAGTPTVDRNDTWQVGYNHYHGRKAGTLDKTGQLITSQILPIAPKGDWNLAYETLTHAVAP
jgi:hypothetical protein